MLSRALTLLFFLGACTGIILCVWTLSLIFYVFDTTAEDPGLIAEVPKEFFILTLLVLLGFIPKVQRVLRRLGFHD